MVEIEENLIELLHYVKNCIDKNMLLQYNTY